MKTINQIKQELRAYAEKMKLSLLIKDDYMKRLIYLIALIPLSFSLFSCCEDEDFKEINTPTFKVTSFEKKIIDSIYYCEATIKITNIPEEYSIDGILYAYDIKKCWKDNPYNEDVLYDFRKEGNNKYYFNLYGKHKGNMTVTIGWVSRENKENYLIGWHLTYGFGDNCEVLIVDLNTSIIK